MSKFKKISFWIVGAVLILWLINSDLSAGSKLSIIIGIIVYALIIEQNKRFRKIENAIGILADPKSEDQTHKPLSYKTSIIIEPEWDKIIQKLAEENKVSIESLYKIIENDKKLSLLEEQRLFGKNFRFVYFHDGISNLEQIWSDHYKTFIDELGIRGHIFHGKNIFSWDSKGDTKFSDRVVITPRFLGFDTIMPDGSVMDEDMIAKIPFGQIISFFLELQRRMFWEGAMYKVKKFPKNLADELKKNKVKYEAWDYEDYGTGVEASNDLVENEWTKNNSVEIYDQKMISHIFKSPYYSIRLSIEVFE